MMGTNQPDKKAGPCVSSFLKDGHRHRWHTGEIRVFAGAMHSRYETSCRYCPRVRIREYTMRGNHIAGYRTEEKAK